MGDDMRYPSGINKNYQSNISYTNRGMNLEDDLNTTNEYYRNFNIAIIYKKPTPITIVKVDYPTRLDAVIREAYFRTPSTTDYNGLYKGKYVDFEAKETKLSFFPLKNIHTHQIDHLKKVICNGGIGFVIVSFIKRNKVFLLTADKLIKFIEENRKKSIPITFFEQYGHQIKSNYNPRLDYLKIIDKLYFEGDLYEKDSKKN